MPSLKCLQGDSADSFPAIGRYRSPYRVFNQKTAGLKMIGMGWRSINRLDHGGDRCSTSWYDLFVTNTENIETRDTKREHCLLSLNLKMFIKSVTVTGLLLQIEYGKPSWSRYAWLLSHRSRRNVKTD